jgi:hypothetical protein
VVVSKKEEEGVRVAERAKWALPEKESVYCWLKDELLVKRDSQIVVSLEGKEIQTLEGMKAVKMLIPIGGGFLACCGYTMKVYRKSANVYDLDGEYRFQHLPTSALQLSPQEDMVAFYNEKAKTICWAHNWEVQEKISKVREIALEKIEMLKEDEVRAYSSPQNLFAVTTGSLINIYSPVSYHSYLCMRTSVRETGRMNDKRKLMRASTLVSAKMLNEMSEGEPIETLGIHPAKSIVAIAFKNCLRVYLILYNDFKVLKELPLSHCKEVGFSNGGAVMHAKLGGKQGSKIYLYNLEHNYDCIEILNTSRPVIQILWTPFDLAVYAVHANGYYTWGTDSMFKLKYDSSLKLGFAVRGAGILHSSLLLWGS